MCPLFVRFDVFVNLHSFLRCVCCLRIAPNNRFSNSQRILCEKKQGVSTSWKQKIREAWIMEHCMTLYESPVNESKLWSKVSLKTVWYIIYEILWHLKLCSSIPILIWQFNLSVYHNRTVYHNTIVLLKSLKFHLVNKTFWDICDVTFIYFNIAWYVDSDQPFLWPQFNILLNKSSRPLHKTQALSVVTIAKWMF